MNITNSLNETINNNDLPTISDYFSDLTTLTTISLVIGSLLYILSVSIFITSIAQSLKCVQKQYLAHTICLLGIYPICCTAALCTLFVPKSVFINHTVMHLIFTLGVVALFKICFLYVGGEENFIKETGSDVMSFQTPPCCCCCVCFHRSSATKNKIRALHYMVFQLPLVQFAIMMAINYFFAYDHDKYKTVTFYFAPFMILSFLTAIWSLNVTSRMIEAHSKGQFGLIKKLFCVQLVLLICKLQFVILDFSLESVNFGGTYPNTNTVYKQAITNLLILLEMVPLSIFAKFAYKTPTSL